MGGDRPRGRDLRPRQDNAHDGGSFLFEPANGIHYDQARYEAVTVQIMGLGPVKTTRIETDR